MRIINKLDGAGCGKGVEELTKQVIQNSKLDCMEVIIEDYEFAKRVTLEIDEADYTIRIWHYHPLDNDKNGHICRAVVSYTLLMTAQKKDGSVYNEEIDENSLMVVWKN